MTFREWKLINSRNIRSETWRQSLIYLILKLSPLLRQRNQLNPYCQKE